jgi:hypothetical protein
MRVDNTGVVVAGTSLRLLDVVSRRYEEFNIGPHFPAARIEYTIPTNRVVIVHHVIFHWRRETSATTAGLCQQLVEVTQPGIATYTLCRSFYRTNEIGNYKESIFPCNMVLRPGEVLRVFTGDMSTGGTCSFLGNVVLLIYQESR